MRTPPIQASGQGPLDNTTKRRKAKRPPVIEKESGLNAIVENTLFRSLIENSMEILVVVNGMGEIVYYSPSIEKYFGISSNEQLRTNAFEYIHPDDIPRLAISFMEVLKNPGKSFFIESRAQTKEGRPIWVEGTVTNLLGTDGVQGIVCNFRDVTERKNSEKQLIQATIDAQEKEREDIGRELHDNVNQILTTARLYLDCIGDVPFEQRHIIQRSSEIITTAIEEIRKLSKSLTQSFQKEIGLKLSVEDLAESIRRLEDGLRITLDFSLPAEELLDDKLKTAVFRILQEQLNNVLKHAGASLVHVTIRQDPEFLTVLITDNGKGFDTGKKRKGIGLNNIISRTEVFNGQVTIDSSPGKGCRMSVIFRLNGGTRDRP
ncbi:MAG TPA: PAS domain S-box protein [Puia sp.]|nr:PAS domain S-box protein [Puia sp.]